MRPLLVLAAAAATAPVLVHGLVGHRWMRGQLAAVDLPPSALLGDADVGRRVFAVTWHEVTAAFAVAAGALWLMAVEVFASRALLLFLSALHVGFALVALAVLARRLDAVRGPVPAVFATCMTTVAVATLLAAR